MNSDVFSGGNDQVYRWQRRSRLGWGCCKGITCLTIFFKVGVNIVLLYGQKFRMGSKTVQLIMRYNVVLWSKSDHFFFRSFLLPSGNESLTSLLLPLSWNLNTHTHTHTFRLSSKACPSFRSTPKACIPPFPSLSRPLTSGLSLTFIEFRDG